MKRILVISVNTDSDYYEYVRERGQESIVALLLQSYFDARTLLMQHDQTIQDTITDFGPIKGKFLTWRTSQFKIVICWILSQKI